MKFTRILLTSLSHSSCIVGLRDMDNGVLPLFFLERFIFFLPLNFRRKGPPLLNKVEKSKAKQIKSYISLCSWNSVYIVLGDINRETRLEWVNECLALLRQPKSLHARWNDSTQARTWAVSFKSYDTHTHTHIGNISFFLFDKQEIYHKIWLFSEL